ncbi:MAG: hypothetical protein PHC43_00195 [Candidatus Marinimicrobia bacterium]|jgi:hypothetical protein|nr:hypothetical protein [Candidatus Neomarinimicrobiota bacterium]
MGLSKEVKEILTNNFRLAHRPAQVYTVAVGAYNLFAVVDGPIEVITAGGYVTAAAVGATTLATTFSGIAGEAGAVAINGAVGTVVYIPVNVGGAILNAAAIPKTVATLTSMFVGPGNIIGTFGAGTSWTGELFLVYKKLSPRSFVRML